MEPGTKTHSARTPSTGGDGSTADTVDQAVLKTLECLERQVIEGIETNTHLKRLLAAQEKATSYKADAYQAAKIAVGVAIGGATAGGLLWWMIRPSEPELTVASMPAKK